MGLKDQLQQVWKKAGVSEERMARLVLSMDQEAVQLLKDHAAAEVLVENIFWVEE